MINIKQKTHLLVFFLISIIFNWQHSYADNYNYDKYLTGYEYFAKVQNFNFCFTRYKFRNGIYVFAFK